MSVKRFVSMVVLGSTLFLLMLCGGVATAADSKLASNGNFHSAGGSGIAVDQSTGDVFTVGLIGTSGSAFELGHSEKFDALGKIITPPSPFDPGLHYGAAINPTNGRLYVARPFGEIEIDDPNTGEELSSFEVPPFIPEFSFQAVYGDEVQIATDPSGDVYVPNMPNNEVLKYSEGGSLLATFTGSGVHALKGPRGVAVDASGNVWVADYDDNRIEELSSTGVYLNEFETEAPTALALDGHGDVLAIVDNGADDCGPIKPPCEHLVEYSESGAQLADLGAGHIGSPNDEYAGARIKESMVAVDQASGRVYVSDGLKNVVWVYEPALAPTVARELAVEVGAFEAKLGALVRPGGIQTTYRFEYDAREYREGEAPHGVSVPFPEGSAGEGFSARAVWAAAKGLAPDTTYHYRVIVANGLGSVVGPDQTFATETAVQATCPNEQARDGFSADLPECRAYELVTPPGKSSAQPDTLMECFQENFVSGELNPEKYIGGVCGSVAANDGNRFAYSSSEIMPGSQSAGLGFIATRGANGWSSEDAVPLRPYTANRCNFPVAAQTGILDYSPDLAKALLDDNASSGENADLFAEGCRGESIEAVSGEPFEQNLLERDNQNGSYQLVNLTPVGVDAEPALLVAASADLNIVVFTDRAKLTPDAVSGAENLFEWNEGAVHLLKLELPSGAPVAGAVVSLSANGSDLFFTANGQLYVRVQGQHTVQLDEVRGGSGSGGRGKLAAVSADGSQVFFTDDATAGLTSDTVAGSGKNLYRYNMPTGQLTDLTPVGDAKVEFVGMSQDGSYVFFSSEGVQSGSQANQRGETAQEGEPNLYLEHNGTIAFVINATLIARPRNGGKADALSQDGAFFAFNSMNNLTGYDSRGGYEIYLYSAFANRWQCASCNPSGEPPTAEGAILGNVPHEVSDSGQVFFQTSEALLPGDTNDQFDPYEFDYVDGLHLVSTGTSSGPSLLLDASVSGNDVFFLTSQSLVSQDSSQEAHHIYDARVNGGLPEALSPPLCTTADACRSAATSQPAIYGAPSSQTFAGVGNLTLLSEAKSKPKAKPKPKAANNCSQLRNKRKRKACDARHRKRGNSNRNAKSHKGGK